MPNQNSLGKFAGLIKEIVKTFRDISVSRIGLPSMVVNKYLIDSRALLDGDIEEAVERCLLNPEFILAAVENIEGSKLFGDEYLEQSRFFALYGANLPADVFIFAWEKPEDFAEQSSGGAYWQIAKSRESLIYFAQNIVRYGHHFGGVYKDVDAFQRFCRFHLPGIILLNRNPGEFELLLLRCLQYLGIEVWQVGERYLPDANARFVSSEELRAALVRAYEEHGWHSARPGSRRSDNERSLHAVYGGGYNSFLVVRSMGGVDGVDVRGEVTTDIGIIIDIGDSDIDITMTAFIEEKLIELLNETGNVKVEIDEWLKIHLDPESTTLNDLGKLVYSVLKSEFDLKQVSVNVLCDPFRLGSLKPAILAYRENREKELDRQDDLNSSFYMCTRCRSYSKDHFCVVTPERPPHCGRSYEMIKTLAHASESPEYIPIKKGELLDRKRGEFAGINKIARLMSGGGIKRLHLHSFTNYPHPSSAEFDILAFHIARLDGIGLIHKGFGGVTPDGRTWDELACAATGRQCPGIIATSLAYIGSRMFLAANGGAANILWMTSHIKSLLKWDDRRIATEKDCANLTALKNYY